MSTFKDRAFHPLIRASLSGTFGNDPMARFLADHGTVLPGSDLPGAMKLGPIKQCFRNAWAATLRYGFDYWEGYAWDPRCGLRPFYHAWCVDPVDDRVRDTTWRDATDVVYLGVHVPTESLIENLDRTEMFGILDKGRRFEHGTAAHLWDWVDKPRR
ncbi:hypothetical protein [Pseudooceanicola sp. MF1-13]|uniref:hypothetical protein n=1 Tax=Pseudooceanicola sp. MF1-13 TaxID=3379095 RepID=UPI003891720F